MRITKRRTERNKASRGVFRSSIKKTREAVASGNLSEAKKWLGASIKSMDKAVQKKILKKNTAARKKSRLNKLVKNLATKK
jgi:small subunit ribosomal protein S20